MHSGCLCLGVHVHVHKCVIWSFVIPWFHTAYFWFSLLCGFLVCVDESVLSLGPAAAWLPVCFQSCAQNCDNFTAHYYYFFE